MFTSLHQLKAFQFIATPKVSLKQMKENVLMLRMYRKADKTIVKCMALSLQCLSTTVTTIITVFLCKTLLSYSLHCKHALRDLLNYFHFLSWFSQFSEISLVLKVSDRNIKVNAAMSFDIKGLQAVGVQRIDKSREPMGIRNYTQKYASRDDVWGDIFLLKLK
jgi:hypothetical protein